MFRAWRVLSSVVSAWLLGSGVLCLPVAARDVSLVLSPQKIPAETDKWSLLPPEKSLIDGDAVPLYEKAAQALPDKAVADQIVKWLDMPIDQMPLTQVEEGLSKYMEGLKCVARAVRCRQCNWPKFRPGMKIANLNEYHRLGFAICLWARLEMADERYEGAVIALRTGFGMARHLGQGPTILQGLVANAIAASMCGEIEELVQRRGAPNLYLALAGLPRPFVDMEKTIENERNAAMSTPAGEQTADQLKSSYDRVRLLATRLSTHLAALQCVEAIRSYAASHDGRLPAALADITEVSVPTDPMVDGPFNYAQTGSTAVLESSPAAGADEKNRIRYEISVKK